LARAFLWEYRYQRLKLAQLLGQLGVFLTWAAAHPQTERMRVRRVLVVLEAEPAEHAAEDVELQLLGHFCGEAEQAVAVCAEGVEKLLGLRPHAVEPVRGDLALVLLQRSPLRVLPVQQRICPVAVLCRLCLHLPQTQTS
jgi:hypothetical protein